MAMNSSISQIQGQLNRASALFEQYQKLSAAHPKNIEYELSLITFEKHIKELQQQIYQEKLLRGKEIIWIRLKGEMAKFGTIPLDVLGELASNISGAILAGSQNLKEGGRLKGKIPKDIIHNLDLRFAGITSGSTCLILTGSLSPDLFGNSLLEDTLENAFGLLNAETPEQLTEIVPKLGVRSIMKINRLLKTLETTGLVTEFRWDSPTDKKIAWHGDEDKIRKLSEALLNIRIEEPQKIEVIGKLIMASLRGQFELETKRGFSYRGSFPSDLSGQVQKLHLGEYCKAAIEKKKIINLVTESEKIVYSLIDIKPTT